MATLADASILGNFTVVFTVIFAFVLVYGILEYIKPFKVEAKGLHGLIALVFAFFVIVIILFKGSTLSSKLLFIDRYKEKLYYFSKEKIGRYKSDKDKISFFDRFFKKK